MMHTKFTYDETAPGCLRCATTGRTYKQKPGEYMQVVLTGGKRDRAHRVVWEIHHGQIPEGDAG